MTTPDISQISKFHFFVLIATLGPIFFTLFGIAGGVSDFLEQYDAAIIAIVFGTGHVAATSFFFVDKDSRQLILQNRNRFIIAPLVLVVVFGTFVYFTGIAGARYLAFINVLYLFFHYQKQNFGLMSLANKGLPQEARPLVNAILFLPMMAGYIVYGQHILQGSSLIELLQPYDEALQIIARLFYAGGLAAMLMLFYRFGDRINWLAKILTVSTCLFFSPLFLFPDDASLAFSSFATAHGAQYLLIMSYTVAGTRSSIMYLRGAATILTVGVLLQSMHYSLVFAGAALGLTWGHYLIDARIWKLSLPDSRAYVLSRIKQFI